MKNPKTLVIIVGAVPTYWEITSVKYVYTSNGELIYVLTEGQRRPQKGEMLRLREVVPKVPGSKDAREAIGVWEITNRGGDKDRG